MKIKCPDCNEEFNNMIEFGVHCREYPETSLIRYAILVTKIHEKIEFWNDGKWDDKLGVMVIIKELKSLLENDEK